MQYMFGIKYKVAINMLFHQLRANKLKKMPLQMLNLDFLLHFGSASREFTTTIKKRGIVHRYYLSHESLDKTES